MVESDDLETRSEASGKGAASGAMPLDGDTKAKILYLHRKGKTAQQIAVHYSIADLKISADAVSEVIDGHKGTTFPPSGNTGEKGPASYSAAELKEWMDSAKNNDVSRMREIHAAQPSLLDAVQGGIGNSALHWAAARSSQQVLEFLLQKNASTGVRNSSGSTPLHSAAANGALVTVRALLQAGADVNLTDSDGRTPRTLADGLADQIAAKKRTAAAAAAQAGSGGKEEEMRVEREGPSEQTVEQMQDLLELVELAGEMRGKKKEEWALGDMTALLDLAGGDRRGLVEKEDLAPLCERCLDDVAAGRYGTAGTSFLKSRYAAAGGASSAGAGGPDAGEKSESKGGSGGGGTGWDDKVAKLKARGNDAFGKEDWVGAVRSYGMALNLDPNNHVLLSNRSAAYARVGQYPEALQDAEMAVELSPGWARGHTRLGAALLGLSRFSDAIEAYKRALQLDPDSAATRDALAHAQRSWALNGAGGAGGAAGAAGGGGSRVPRSATAAAGGGGAGGEGSSIRRGGGSSGGLDGRRGSGGVGREHVGGSKPAADVGGSQESGRKGGVGGGGDDGGEAERKRKQGRLWLRAAQNGEVEVMRALLAEDPGLMGYCGAGTSFEFAGHSAMHWCAAKGHINGLRLLLEASASLSVRNKGGSTPLHSAAHADQVECIQLLLEHKADPTLRDIGGATPADAARHIGSHKAIAFLQSYAAGAAATSPAGESLPRPVDSDGHQKAPDAFGSQNGEIQRSAGADGSGGMAGSSASSGSAEEWKALGNEAFKVGDFAAAERHYTAALNAHEAEARGGACRDSQAGNAELAAAEAAERRRVLLSNRSAARVSGGNPAAALVDAEELLRIAPEWAKTYSRAGAAYLACGDAYDAARVYRRGLDLEPDNGAMRDGLRDAERRLRQLTTLYGDDLPSTGSDSEDGPDAARTSVKAKSDQDSGRTQAHTAAKASATAPSGVGTEGSGGHSNTRPDSGSAGGGADSDADAFVPPLAQAAAEAPPDFDTTFVPKEEGRAFMESAKAGDAAAMRRQLLARPDLLWFRGQGTTYGFVAHSALHYAAGSGRMDCLRLLLLCGTPPNLRNRGGSTPLHAAAMNDKVDAATLLLRCGADPRLTDEPGERPEECARRRGRSAAADAIARFAAAGRRPEPIGRACLPVDPAERKQMLDFLERLAAAWRAFPKPTADDLAAAAAAARRKEQDAAAEVEARARAKAEAAAAPPRRASSSEDSDGGDGGGGGCNDAAAKRKAAMAARIEGLKGKGNEAFKGRDFVAAASAYSMAIRLDPGNHVLLSNRSATYAEMGDYAKALEDADKVVGLAPDWAKGHARKAAAHMGCGQFVAAAAAYGRAAGLDASTASYREGLRRARAAAGLGGGDDDYDGGD